MKRFVVLISMLAFVTVGFTACGDDKKSDTTGSSPTSTESTSGGGGAGDITVVEKEYSVAPSVSSTKAGEVTFTAKNDGSMAHDLWIVKTDDAADKLPVKDAQVDTKAAGIEVVGKTPTFEPGASEMLKVDLKPGKYVLFCNVAGHYQAGMYKEFTVS